MKTSTTKVKIIHPLTKTKKWVDVPVMVAYTHSPLAITQVPTREAYTITFLPSGENLPVIHRDWQGSLTALLDSLVKLPWPNTAEEVRVNRVLVEAVKVIIKDWEYSLGSEP